MTEQQQSESNALDLALRHKFAELRDQIEAIHGFEKAEKFMTLLKARFEYHHLNGTLESLDPEELMDILNVLDMD